MADFSISPGAMADPLLSWMNIHWHKGFSAIASAFEMPVAGIVHLLSAFPAPVTICILSVLALLAAGWRVGLLCLAGLSACVILGMWGATIQTLALVVVSVAFSLLAGIPLGVMFSRTERRRAAIRPVLDIMQTLPPWVYLVPAVILFGLGAVPALLSTILYGIAPAMRLTMLAMGQVPAERIELGNAIGATKRQVFWKIEFPSALPTMMIGVNQCILLSLAMVVLAGLVGAGGLGSEVTRGVTRLEFGLGMRASLSIVFLAILMDRVCQGAVPRAYLNAAGR